MSKTSKVFRRKALLLAPVADGLSRLKGFIVRLSLLSKPFPTFSLVVLLLIAAQAQAPSGDAAKVLPEQVGDFRSQGAPKLKIPHAVSPVKLEDFSVISEGEREYVSPDGERFSVHLDQTASSSAAYSLLRYYSDDGKPVPYKFRMVDGLGVVGVAGARVIFIKGETVVHVAGMSAATNSEEAALSFAKSLAGALEGEAGEIPVLVLHLPEWEQRHGESGYAGVGYAVSSPALRVMAKSRGLEQSVLDAVSFDGGAEAVTASYGDARLVVVEFITPQASVENDQRINERIAQLRAEGKPTPSAYKRVGNYSVFVFDAPDSAAAEQLLAGVKYEKDVRWLGRNPHGDEIAQRAYTLTMTSMILTVIKTTGLAIAVCLGVGTILGGLVFMRRRARAAAGETYSDAGGMIRLDLVEDVSAPARPSHLLGRGKE